MGTIAIEIAGPNTEALFLHSIGSADGRFADGLMRQLVNAVPHVGGEPDTQAFDFMLAVVSAVEPRDEIEAMITSQMAPSICRQRPLPAASITLKPTSKGTARSGL